MPLQFSNFGLTQKLENRRTGETNEDKMLCMDENNRIKRSERALCYPAGNGLRVRHKCDWKGMCEARGKGGKTKATPAPCSNNTAPL